MSLALQARPLWRTAKPDTAREAVELLETLPPGPSLAVAYGEWAYLLMLRRQVAASIDVATRAVELSERFGARTPLMRALNALGSSLWFTDPASAEPPLLRSIELAKQDGDDDSIGDGLANMGSAAGEVRWYPTSERWLRELIAWGATRDQHAAHDYGRAWLVRILVGLGRWPEADDAVAHVPYGAGIDHPHRDRHGASEAPHPSGRPRCRSAAG